MFCLSPVNQVVVACALFFTFSSGALQFGLASCTLTSVKAEFVADQPNPDLLMALVIASYQVTQILMSPVGPILDVKTRWTPELMCGVGILINMCGAFMYGFAQNYPMLIVGQLLNGCGGGAVNVLMPLMFAKLVEKPSEISLAIAKCFVATPVGIILASLSCGSALSADPGNWRWLFIGFGSCLIAPMAAFFVIAWRYTTVGDPRKIPNETATFGMAIQHIIKAPNVMLSVAGITCSALVVAGLSAFLAAYYEEHLGTTKSFASYMVAATVPSVCIGTMVGGYVSNRLGYTRKQLLGFCSANVLAAFLITLIIFPGDVQELGVVIATFIVAMFFLFMVAGPAVAVAATLLPINLVGYGQVVVNMISRALGGIIGPIFVGALLGPGRSKHVDSNGGVTSSSSISQASSSVSLSSLNATDSPSTSPEGLNHAMAFFITTLFLVLSALWYAIGWVVTPFEEKVERGHDEPCEEQNERGEDAQGDEVARDGAEGVELGETDQRGNPEAKPPQTTHSAVAVEGDGGWSAEDEGPQD